MQSAAKMLRLISKLNSAYLPDTQIHTAIANACYITVYIYMYVYIFTFYFSFFIFLFCILLLCEIPRKFFVYLTAKKRCEDMSLVNSFAPLSLSASAPLFACLPHPHLFDCPFWQLSICRICQLQNALSKVGVGVGVRVLGLGHATISQCTHTRTHTVCHSACAIKCNKL